MVNSGMHRNNFFSQTSCLSKQGKKYGNPCTFHLLNTSANHLNSLLDKMVGGSWMGRGMKMNAFILDKFASISKYIVPGLSIIPVGTASYISLGSLGINPFILPMQESRENYEQLINLICPIFLVQFSFDHTNG